jgi:hypothetical protein
MPLVVWAAKCKSRDAMAALLNAGVSPSFLYNGSRFTILSRALLIALIR